MEKKRMKDYCALMISTITSYKNWLFNDVNFFFSFTIYYCHYGPPHTYSKMGGGQGTAITISN